MEMYAANANPLVGSEDQHCVLREHDGLIYAIDNNRFEDVGKDGNLKLIPARGQQL